MGHSSSTIARYDKCLRIGTVGTTRAKKVDPPRVGSADWFQPAQVEARRRKFIRQLLSVNEKRYELTKKPVFVWEAVSVRLPAMSNCHDGSGNTSYEFRHRWPCYLAPEFRGRAVAADAGGDELASGPLRENLVAILAEQREALAVMVPGAFGTVSGL